jgi:hypothetical protein
MEVNRFSETSVHVQTTRCHVPENDNIKSRINSLIINLSLNTNFSSWFSFDEEVASLHDPLCWHELTVAETNGDHEILTSGPRLH